MKRSFDQANFGQPSSFRPGDWMCTQCGAHNYASKSLCFRCGMGMMANYGNYGQAMHGGHGGGGMGGIFIDVAKFRAGDWLCISCKAHNYASKHSCYKCSAAKPQSENTGKIEGAAELPENFRPGDWICPGCNGHNYHSKTFCFRCNLAKPAK
eukprot:jgi/Bigna1/45259/e_gw1.116.19.1